MLNKKLLDLVNFEAVAPDEIRGHLGFYLARARLTLLERLDAAIADPDLRTRHFGILSLLARHQGLRQTDIGAIFGIDRTSVMKTVNELEKRGFVRRSRHGEDRRANALEITAEGRAWQESRRAPAEAGEAEFLKPLSQGERALLRELLVKLLTVDNQ